MRKILITGHRGFIGSHLVNFLQGDMELSNCEIEGLDLVDGQNILDCELPEADIVIHLAADSSVIESMKDPSGVAKTNILGTIRLVEKYKGKKFIFASSGGTIQETIESPYGLSKFCAEEYIKLLHNNFVILRFPNIFGPRSHSVVEKFINGPVNIFGDGSSSRDYVHVYDLILAIKESVGWKQGTYRLGSGKNTLTIDLAKATGKPINFLPKVSGELQHSFVKNDTEWKPIIDVTEYIKKEMKNAK